MEKQLEMFPTNAEYFGHCSLCTQPYTADNKLVAYSLSGQRTYCLACSSIVENQANAASDRITLYYGYGRADVVTNWTGDIRFRVERTKTGNHNMTGRRADVWFTAYGSRWHGVQYGSDTELLHCTRLKG